MAKLKEFFAKLKVSENPVAGVAAKWLKKKADLERISIPFSPGRKEVIVFNPRFNQSVLSSSK